MIAPSTHPEVPPEASDDAPPASPSLAVPCPLSPVPSLCPSDRALLFAYFEHHENLAALAATLAAGAAPSDADDSASSLMPDAQCLMPSSDYFSLLTWLSQPHIQEALDAHDSAVARADRRRALDALRQSLDTADNPTNLRRAATTLLRSTVDGKPNRQGGRPSRPPRDGSTPPSPRGTRGEVSGGPSEVKPTDGEGCVHVRTDSLPTLPPLPPLQPLPAPAPTPASQPIATAGTVEVDRPAHLADSPAPDQVEAERSDSSPSVPQPARRGECLRASVPTTSLLAHRNLPRERG